MDCIDDEINKGRTYQISLHPAYHLGEKVYKMKGDKIGEFKITLIRIEISKSEPFICYRLNHNTGFYSEEWMKQYAFRTKQELIESL